MPLLRPPAATCRLREVVGRSEKDGRLSDRVTSVPSGVSEADEDKGQVTY